MKAVVRDVMSIRPISVRKATAVKEVAVRLRADRVSAFPVLDHVLAATPAAGAAPQ